MSRVKDMTQGNPVKLILSFAFPLILTNIGQQLYMIVDAAIVGRGVGVKALAAVGCTDWSYWVILWAVTMMTQGFATFISRYFGMRNFQAMNKAVANSTVLCLVVGTILTVAGLLAVKPLLQLLQTPADILPDAVTYLSTMVAGTLIITAYNMAASILRAFGDGRSPLIAMIVAAVMNILLDLLFVMLFRWGVFGAALASLISQLVAFGYCFFRITKIECVQISRSDWILDLKMSGELLKFAMPLALQYIVINLGGVILQSTINLQGSIFIAGYTAVNKLYGLLECTAVGLGLALTTYFSQNYGAGNVRRIRSGHKTALLIMSGAAMVVMTLVLVFGKYLLQLFIDPAEAGAADSLGIGNKYLLIMALNMIILYWIYVYRSIMQAMGDSIWSMISGFAEFAARVLMAKAVFLLFGQETLFYIEPVAWVMALLFVMVPCFPHMKRKLSEKAKPAAES